MGQAEKDDPPEVAKIGFEAMTGRERKCGERVRKLLQAALAHVTSSAPVAELQRKKPNLLRQKLTAENLLNRAAQDSANSELC